MARPVDYRKVVAARTRLGDCASYGSRGGSAAYPWQGGRRGRLRNGGPDTREISTTETPTRAGVFYRLRLVRPRSPRNPLQQIQRVYRLAAKRRMSPDPGGSSPPNRKPLWSTSVCLWAALTTVDLSRVDLLSPQRNSAGRNTGAQVPSVRSRHRGGTRRKAYLANHAVAVHRILLGRQTISASLWVADTFLDPPAIRPSQSC
jgi:hypothetical protein